MNYIALSYFLKLENSEKCKIICLVLKGVVTIVAG